MKWVAGLSLLAGLALATLLVAHFGVGDVGHAIEAAGWGGLFAISAIQFALIAAMGVAWWLLVRRRHPGPSVGVFIWGRLLRDAGSDILPLSQVGGYVLGARAVMLHGVDAITAAASSVVDVTLELFGQIIYTAVGVALLLQFRPETPLATPLLIGLIGAAVAAVGFVGVQLRRKRGIGLLDRLAGRLSRGWLAAIASGTDAVHDEVRALYGEHLALLGGFLLHLTAWFASAVEAWIALHLMGAHLGFGPVLVIESLLYAIRSAAFLVPNAVGVQEGAYVLIGGAFGLPPDVALALSLLKRARDLVLGVPALLAWQFWEGRRLWSARSEPPAPPVAAGDEAPRRAAGGGRLRR